MPPFLTYSQICIDLLLDNTAKPRLGTRVLVCCQLLTRHSHQKSEQDQVLHELFPLGIQHAFSDCIDTSLNPMLHERCRIVYTLFCECNLALAQRGRFTPHCGCAEHQQIL